MRIGELLERRHGIEVLVQAVVGVSEDVIGALAVDVDQIVDATALADLLLGNLNLLIHEHGQPAVCAVAALPPPDGLVLADGLLLRAPMLQRLIVVAVKIGIEREPNGFVLHGLDRCEPDNAD